MTSTTGSDEHPEVSEISDLTDGLLTPSRTTQLRDHLAGCPLCADVQASLEEIRGLLGTLPGPTRMPSDVAGRIDAALAAEALLDSTTPATGTLVSRETSMHADSVSRETSAGSTSVSPETSALGSSVSRETDVESPTHGAPSDRPAGRPRGTSGPGRQTPGGRSSRSRRWPRILLGTAAAAAAISIGGLLFQNASTNGTPTTMPDRAPSTQQAPGGSALTSASLEAHVHGLLAAKHKHKSPEIGTRSSPETPLRGTADTVPSCVRKGIGRTETPLASSHNTYNGKDAYLVVLPHPSDPSRVSAYVVSSSCVSATPPTPGKVLLTHSYRRD
ncbi:anti-sigma factor family protein [Streptomyces chattanoogensis]|uniref:anti-sigma factor family protein n=1 Tax=Streptomyces chattanoogensis TaxID=66876 RepID=UPI0036A0AEE6